MRLSSVCAAAAALVLGVAAVQANTLVASLQSVSGPQVIGGNTYYIWTYDIDLGGTGILPASPIAGEPDFLTLKSINGFAGFNGIGGGIGVTTDTFTGAGPSTWNASVSGADLTFTYAGSGANLIHNITPVVLVSFYDTTNKVGAGTYVSRDHFTTGGSGVVNGYNNLVLPQGIDAPAVPTPAAAMSGMVLLGLTALGRLMRRDA